MWLHLRVSKAGGRRDLYLASGWRKEWKLGCDDRESVKVVEPSVIRGHGGIRLIAQAPDPVFQDPRREPAASSPHLKPLLVKATDVECNTSRDKCDQ